MLPNNDAVRAVGLGKGGLAEATTGAKVWIDFSSIDKKTIIGVNAELAKKGWTILDGSAGGVEEAAAAGTLSLWISGSKTLFDEHQAVFRAMGNKVLYVGELGNAKLVKNAMAMFAAVTHLTLAEICARHGITTEQYGVLRILRDAYPDGRARGEVAERCIHTRAPDTTRMLDRLVRQGLARRSRDPDDRRCSLATITKPGLALLARMDPDIAGAMRRSRSAMIDASSSPTATSSRVAGRRWSSFQNPRRTNRTPRRCAALPSQTGSRPRRSSAS